jgi:hypothetical protein
MDRTRFAAALFHLALLAPAPAGGAGAGGGGGAARAEGALERLSRLLRDGVLQRACRVEALWLPWDCGDSPLASDDDPDPHSAPAPSPPASPPRATPAPAPGPGPAGAAVGGRRPPDGGGAGGAAAAAQAGGRGPLFLGEGAARRAAVDRLRGGPPFRPRW